MTEEVLINGLQNTLANTRDVTYTSPIGSGGTKITAVSVSNPTGINRSFKAYFFSRSID